ncbi:hypothetical protein AWRI1631_151160 [Saccharomyces cerevisiae AWRI1631]|uniref:Uncharacterized protein n=1 Tax=Saccharomyces cerevisiae (strain AWRI1631) TaxID=545124 RepID=B5VRK8_YEAS6|nr:hypothetical protein AWRI1631_151160 [Saccharomyces cerevisiae AWRI1631]
MFLWEQWTMLHLKSLVVPLTKVNHKIFGLLVCYFIP